MMAANAEKMVADTGEETRLFINEREISPFYHRIKTDLLGKIERGVYREGEKIDSEISLCRQYGVSRPTIRHAIEQLVHDGYLWRKQGKGTFVSATRIHKNLNEYTPFAEDVKTIGKNARLRILTNKRIGANREIADKLGMEPGAEVLKVAAIRMMDSQPMVYRVSYYVVALLPTLQETVREDVSMFEAIHTVLGKDSGLYIAKAKQTFRVVTAGEQEAEYLRLPLGAPLIQWEGLNYLNNGKAIEYYFALSNSEKYTFSVEQTRR